MENKESAYKKKFWVLTLIGILVVISFFIYGFHFDIWGRKFYDLPKHVHYVYIILVIFGFSFICYFIRFIGKYETMLAEKKEGYMMKNPEKTVESVK